MNTSFKAFFELPANERRAVFEAGAERLNTLASYIEKDFWLCYTLDVLYNVRPQSQPRLLFKGGTSLSKVFNTIQRFSEDIDIVVFREDLGFSGDHDPANPALSNKQRNRLVDELNASASQYIQGKLAELLQSNLPDCQVIPDPDDDIAMTLLVQYQSLYESGSDEYVQPRIKLEGGARSSVEPHDIYEITPYIQPILSDYDLTVPSLITIDAERTLLDKTIILHGWYCGHRDEGRRPTDRNRLSRHYYDVAMMAATTISERALSNQELFNDVVHHAKLFFRRGWMKLDEAVPGKMNLVPVGTLYKSLEKDYTAMQEMLFGDIPSFSAIIEQLTEFQERIND